VERLRKGLFICLFVLGGGSRCVVLRILGMRLISVRVENGACSAGKVRLVIEDQFLQL
jgi:hypothetical protein